MKIKHLATIEGRRIRLRPALLSDQYRIFQGLVRWQMVDILRGPPALKNTPLIDFDEFCKDYRGHYFDDSGPEHGRCFVIEADGQAVGQINYNAIDRRRSRTELDIWMFSERHCEHGYGTEALTLLCDYLQKHLGVDAFLIQPAADNPRAIRCYEKAGFTRTDLTVETGRCESGHKRCIGTLTMTRIMGRCAG
jgi:RimJ/RimL family protein N-acetyltransferase